MNKNKTSCKPNKSDKKSGKPDITFTREEAFDYIISKGKKCRPEHLTWLANNDYIKTVSFSPRRKGYSKKSIDEYFGIE